MSAVKAAAALPGTEPAVPPHAPGPVARRIVIVIGALATGGAERVATTMANAWAAEGRQVWLVSTYLHGRACGYPLHPQVTTVLLSDQLRGRRLPRWLGVLWKLRALRRTVRAIGPDTVVSFLTNVNVLTIVALAGLRLPLIVSERTDPAADIELPWSVRRARVLLYRRADALVVQSAAAAQRYAARWRGPARVAVIPNPLPRELSVAPLRAGQAGRGGVVIGMGRLGAEKGFAKLIGAYAQALGADASWSLEIWGEGPLRADLQQLITRLGLDTRVRLCGATTQPWTVLAAAQIFVLTSQYEGFPNAMLEAMAVGLPCIAFDCPSGPRELADGGAAATIVPPGDVDKLASSLQRLAADRAARERLGGYAADFVRQRFAEQLIMRDWDRLIASLLPRHG